MCIRRRHVTSQYFNQNVLNFVNHFYELGRDGELNYYKFRRIASSYFQGVGVKTPRNYPGFLYAVTVPDREFWLQVYKYVMQKPRMRSKRVHVHGTP